MKKGVGPKVMAFMALFGILISLFSVGILFVFSPKQENTNIDSNNKIYTQEDINKFVEEYNRSLSGSVELGSGVISNVGTGVTSSGVIDEVLENSGTGEEL